MRSSRTGWTTLKSERDRANAALDRARPNAGYRRQPSTRHGAGERLECARPGRSCERQLHWRRQREQWEPCAAPRRSPPAGAFGNHRGAVMSRLLMLATAARPLSEALIDILRASLKSRPALPAGGDEQDRLGQLDLRLVPDGDTNDSANAMRPLPPDAAAVAIQRGLPSSRTATRLPAGRPPTLGAEGFRGRESGLWRPSRTL